MKIVSTRFGFSTIAIVSGHPRFDKTAARIIDTLSAQSREPLNFVGVIGDQYEKKLSQVYSSSSILDHEEIQITRNYNEAVQESWLNPYRAITHYKNNQLLKKLDEGPFYKDLLQQKASAVISVGNFSLMNRLYSNITEMFSLQGDPMPLRISFDLSIAHRSIDSEQYLDYMYYNLPKSPQNQTKYIFPSMCIGYEGIFRAFQFLQKYRNDPSNASFRSKEFSVEVADLVAKARSEYRTANGINSDQYLTLIAPGNTKKEVKFSFNSFSDGLKKFAAKDEIKGIDRQFFKVLVLVPQEEGISSYIRAKASSLPSNFEVTFVEEKDKYAAMCASDFALLHNGEITVEAAACQLPATVVSSMSNHKAYLSYLYNGHCSPLNVSTNYEGYQDLMGSMTAIGEKISSLMLNNFTRPKLRFHYIKLYREEIQKMLMMMGKNPELNVSRTGIEAAVEDILRKLSQQQELPASVRHYERKERLNLF